MNVTFYPATEGETALTRLAREGFHSAHTFVGTREFVDPGLGGLPSSEVSYPVAAYAAAKKLGAVPADIPGLWNVPGHPELTTGQLIDLAAR
ncbi:hypothetical protein [Sphingobium yanoikuyae]|uniref:Uncharacterized protein n=1 Tax=Sphingobium yanoikuyae TaxID=13690 RepID=A0A430BZ03_SPHYA|nr:hypothetical protein [Sphingobium yanoikuyae]RSU57992.1 hypothetical protein DAH51_07040 [Sphingobium yanoikuyae]